MIETETPEVGTWGVFCTEAIIQTNESDTDLPCIVAGCDLDANATDDRPWHPVWHMDGRVFLGMNCGGHK